MRRATQSITRRLGNGRSGSARYRSQRSVRKQSELAVLDDDEHSRALVHAVVIGRGHIEHPLTTDDLAFLLDRVAKRAAEGLGSRLPGFEGDGNRALEDETGIVGI